MFKTKFPLPGTAPAAAFVDDEPIASSGVEADKPIITLIEYNVGRLEERTVDNAAELLTSFDNNKVSWINIDGLGDVETIRVLGKKFDLHPLALEDVLNTGQRPKLEHYETYYYILAQMIYGDATKRVCSEQVSMFLGKNFLVTIQEESENDVFEAVRRRIRGGKGYLRKMKADYLAYALLDAIIDHTFPILETLGDSIEAFEEEILHRPTNDCVRQLHEYRRALLQLRRAVWPERDVISQLMHDESGLVAKDTKTFLRDCYDHSIQIIDLIENYRDVTSGLMELYLSSVGIRTNEIMRVLTVISSIFIPLTFIAGVYGMNFNPDAGPLSMPELDQPYGYMICVAVMLLIALSQLAYFRKKKWI